ncbi:MAG: hypothetical protein E6K05_04095 [Methanobacteriota archaeon]|nr:MAG: hypothetical protein E6K05_04095 [Euryarchaeota archaeon]
MTRTRRLKITFAYGNPKGHPPNDRSGDVADRFFCFACGRDHRAGSDIARDHKRYSIEGGHESGGIFSDLREFYLQTKGIAAAFRILGLENVKVHPPRFGRGWPSPAAIEKAYRLQALKHHPDAGGDPHEFRKVQWAIEVLRRYRPPDS